MAAYNPIITSASVTRSGTTATWTTTNHGFANGAVVTISGVVPAGYNGTYTISGVTANTFQYTMGADPGSSATTQGVAQIFNIDHFSVAGANDTLTIDRGAVLTVNTNQIRTWNTITGTQGTLFITNTSEISGNRFLIGPNTGGTSSTSQTFGITPGSSLFTLEVSGAFITLGIGNGGAQDFTSPFPLVADPISGGYDFIPCVEVEKISGSDSYEYWFNSTITYGNGLPYARQGWWGIVPDAQKGKFFRQPARDESAMNPFYQFGTHFTNTLKFGEAASVAAPYEGSAPIPLPYGCKVRVPNILLTWGSPTSSSSGATTTGAALQNTQQAGSSGILHYSKCLFGEWRWATVNPAECTFDHCGFTYGPTLGTIYGLRFTNCGVHGGRARNYYETVSTAAIPGPTWRTIYSTKDWATSVVSAPGAYFDNNTFMSELTLNNSPNSTITNHTCNAVLRSTEQGVGAASINVTQSPGTRISNVKQYNTKLQIGSCSDLVVDGLQLSYGQANEIPWNRATTANNNTSVRVGYLPETQTRFQNGVPYYFKIRTFYNYYDPTWYADNPIVYSATPYQGRMNAADNSDAHPFWFGAALTSNTAGTAWSVWCNWNNVNAPTTPVPTQPYSKVQIFRSTAWGVLGTQQGADIVGTGTIIGYNDTTIVNGSTYFYTLRYFRDATNYTDSAQQTVIVPNFTPSPTSLTTFPLITNLCLQSAAPATAPWVAYGTAPTITASVVPGPNIFNAPSSNTSQTSQVLFSAATSGGRSQPVTVSNATQYTIVAEIKGYENSGTSIVVSADSGGASTNLTCDLTRKWNRYSFQHTTSSTTMNLRFNSNSSSLGKLCDLRFAVYAGAVAHQYVNTTTATVTALINAELGNQAATINTAVGNSNIFALSKEGRKIIDLSPVIPAQTVAIGWAEVYCSDISGFTPSVKNMVYSSAVEPFNGNLHFSGNADTVTVKNVTSYGVNNACANRTSTGTTPGHVYAGGGLQSNILLQNWNISSGFTMPRLVISNTNAPSTAYWDGFTLSNWNVTDSRGYNGALIDAQLACNNVRAINVIADSGDMTNSASTPSSNFICKGSSFGDGGARYDAAVPNSFPFQTAATALGQVAVPSAGQFDYMFFESFGQNITGGMSGILFNPTAKTTDVPYVITGGCKFDNAGKLYFGADGDAITYTFPWRIYGTTGWQNLPYKIRGTDMGFNTATCFGAYIEYAISQDGVVYGGFKEMIYSNTSTESINPATGFYLKVRITAKRFFKFTNLVTSVATTSVTWAANALTVTVATAHNVVQGQTVVLAGLTPAAYNGAYVVASFISGTQYTVTQLNNLGNATVQGTTTPGFIIGETIQNLTSSPTATAIVRKILHDAVTPASGTIWIDTITGTWAFNDPIWVPGTRRATMSGNTTFGANYPFIQTSYLDGLGWWTTVDKTKLYPALYARIDNTNLATNSYVAAYNNTTGAWLEASYGSPEVIIQCPWDADFDANVKFRKPGYQFQDTIILPLTRDGISIVAAQVPWTRISGTDAMSGANITLTDYENSPITWNSKLFRFKIQANTTYTAAEIAQWWYWITARDTLVSGYKGTALPALIIEDSGTGYETQIGAVDGDPSTAGGCYIVDISGNAIDNFSRFQANDGSYWLPPTYTGATFSGLQSGSQVVIYQTGTQTVIDRNDSTGTSYTYSTLWVSDQIVDYTIIKVGYLPQRVTGVTFGNSVISVLVSQVTDRVYVASSGLTYGANVIINSGTKKVTVSTNTTLVNLYSFFMESWRDQLALGNVLFPFLTNGPVSITFAYDWELTADSNAIFLNSSGLRYLSTANSTTAVWSAFKSLGFNDGAFPRYQQANGSLTSTCNISGAVNQLIKVYGDGSHGSFDYRSWLVFKSEPDSYLDAVYDVIVDGGVSSLSDDLYTFPLVNVATGIATGTPSISGVTITDHGASPVMWNGKLFSITIQDSSTPNSGTDLFRWITYNTSIGGTFQGKTAFNWHQLVQPTGTNFQTVNGKIYGGVGAALKGVRVVQSDGTTYHPDFVLFTADDGTYWSPPIFTGFSFSGLQAGSQVVIYYTGTTTEIARNNSTGTTYTYSDTYVSDQGVDYTIQKAGYLPQRVVNATMSSSVASVPVTQIPDRTYVAPSGLTFGSTFTVDVTGYRFKTTVATTVQNMYSYSIDSWIAQSTLRNIKFPLTTNGPNSITMGLDWEFDSTQDFGLLSRDGLRYLSSSDVPTAVWCAILSQGDISGGATPKYSQLHAGTSIHNALHTGTFDQLVQIYGDASHGNYDYTGYLTIKVIQDGQIDAYTDVVDVYGTLEDQEYVVALSQTANGEQTGNPALTNPPMLVDHGITAVNWHGVDFSITMTDSAAGNTGSQILRWLSYNKAQGGTFEGKTAYWWHQLVEQNGTKYKTVTGPIEGDVGAINKGVRVVMNDGNTPHPDFNLFTGDTGATYIPPVVNTANVTNIVSGSRLRVYNVTTATEIANEIIIGTSWSLVYTEGTSFTNGDQVQIRLAYQNGITAMLPWKATAIASASGWSALASQTADTVYNTNAIDGMLADGASGGGEFFSDYPNIQINMNDPDGTTSVRRIYAWMSYITTTDEGIRNFFEAMTAFDIVNYTIDQDIVDLRLDNISPIPVQVIDGYMSRRDGTTILATESGHQGIFMDPGKAYAVATASSLLQADIDAIAAATKARMEEAGSKLTKVEGLSKLIPAAL